MFAKRDIEMVGSKYCWSTAATILIFVNTGIVEIASAQSRGWVPVDRVNDVAMPNIIPNTPAYLVNPNGSSNLYFGKWEIGPNGRPVGQALPAGINGSGALQDIGFYQRNIENPATGERYIQQIVTDYASAGEAFNKVGMFSESYVKTNGQNSGVSVLQGMNCGEHNGKCLAPDRGTYMDGQTATSIEFFNKIRTGSFEDPKEKVRLKQLIYETDDPTKWANDNGSTTGTTFYSDIWRASYEYDGVQLGDFVNVVTKTRDIDPLYSYAVLTAEMRFDFDRGDVAIAQREGISLGADPGENPEIYLLSEAEKLRNNFRSNFTNDRAGLEKALNYIRTYIQYRAIAQEGWHAPDAGLARYEMFQSEMSGALVKAGDIKYQKKYNDVAIEAKWIDGGMMVPVFDANGAPVRDTNGNVITVMKPVGAYGTNQDMGFQQQGHEQVTPDTCDIGDMFTSHDRVMCGAKVRYEFATTDVYNLINSWRYDPSVGGTGADRGGDRFAQFKIEPQDLINPFDPFSTVPNLPPLPPP